MQNITIIVSEFSRSAFRSMPEVRGFNAVVECEFEGAHWSFTSKLHDTRHDAETLGVYDAIMQAIGMWEDSVRYAAMEEQEREAMWREFEEFDRWMQECEA